MSWNRYPDAGSSQPDDLSSFFGTGAGTSNNSAFSALQPPHLLTNPAGGSSETASYDTFSTMKHFNFMPGSGVVGVAPELDASAPASYHPQRGDPPYSATVPGHTFDDHLVASYGPGRIIPTAITHPLGVSFDGSAFFNGPIDSSAFASQPLPPRSGSSTAWPSHMTSVLYPILTDPPSVRPPMDVRHLSSGSTGSRATPYPAPSPVLSTVPDYTLEEGFEFHVMARGLSTEPAELKEWKPEHSWDYTIRIEGIKTQMGANIKINLNNPRDIPTGSLGLWFYMKMEESDDLIEGPTCGYCEKRQLTNVSRFKDAITTEQVHTRIICSPSNTWLQPCPDNSAYSADVTFLIWCPAYHDASQIQSHVRVKQARRPFQLVCELRDHTGRRLATTTLRRIWGAEKPSRRSKRDADGRSGHRVSTSGELITPRVDSHILLSSHASLPSPRPDKRIPPQPRSHVPPIKVEDSSPPHTASSRADHLPSRVKWGSKDHVEAPASGTAITSGPPAVSPVNPSPEVEEADSPVQSEDIVEVPAPAKPPVAIYVGSASPQSRRSPAPSPESPGHSVSRSVHGLRIIAPPLSETVIETVPPRADFFGVWREEGRAGDEVRLIGAGFIRETEYFAKFGAVCPIQAFYQASNILTCIVPWSGTVGTVAVSIVSRDGSMVLCEQQQKFRYLSDKKLAALQRIMAALDSADEEDIQEEATDFARRLSSKKQERRSREQGHEGNLGRQHQLSGATAVVNSPVPVGHHPLPTSQPLPDDDDQTLPPSRSSTLVTPLTHVYSFHKIKSLGEDPSSWDRVRSWFERKDPTMVKGRKRSAEEMEDEKGLETSRVPVSPTLVESLAAKDAGPPRVRAQEAHKTSCETQPRLKRQRLNVADIATLESRPHLPL